MRFAMLGPLVVRSGSGQPVEVAGARPRALSPDQIAARLGDRATAQQAAAGVVAVSRAASPRTLSARAHRTVR